MWYIGKNGYERGGSRDGTAGTAGDRAGTDGAYRRRRQDHADVSSGVGAAAAGDGAGVYHHQDMGT